MKLRIRELRKEFNKTQREVSEYLQCDQSLYSKYERGDRDVPLNIMLWLAPYYNTSIDYLVGVTDVREAYPRCAEH